MKKFNNTNIPIRASICHAMGLVLVLALSFGLADFLLKHSDLTMPGASAFLRFRWQIVIYFNSVMAGIAIYGGLCFLTEVVRRRPIAVLGLGRWTWSITSVSSLLILSTKTIQIICFLYADKRATISFEDIVQTLVRAQAEYFSGPILLSLIPVFATTRLMGLPSDPTPGFFEWSGRAYFVTLVLWGVFSQMTIVTGL